LNIEKLTGHEKEMLFGSLAYFEKFKKAGFRATDSTTISNRFQKILPPGIYRKAFTRLSHSYVNDSLYWGWWQKYVSRVSGKQVDSFTIIRSSISWEPHYQRYNDTLSITQYGNQ
jgi:hypothetical protein